MSAFATYFGGDSSESSLRDSDDTSSGSSCDLVERVNRAAALRAKDGGSSLFYGMDEAVPADIAMYDKCVKIDVLDAQLNGIPAYPSPIREKAKRSRKKKRTPIVPGASLSTDVSLEKLRQECHISDEVEFLVPTPNQRIDDPPEGFFSCVESHFRDALLWFPIPKVLSKFLFKHGICLSQLPPGSIRHFVCILVRSFECEIHISLQDLMKFVEIRRNRVDLVHRVYPGYGCRILRKEKFRGRHWFKYFFFVRINSGSIEGRLDLVNTRWGEKVISKLTSDPSGYLDKFELLRLHRCKWSEDFDFERVEHAKLIASGAMSSNESPPLSPRSLTLLSSSLASNREKRVIDKAQTKGDTIVTRSRAAPSRSLEKSLTIKEPSLPPPPPKDTSLSKKASKRPIDGSSKSDRLEKKSKTSAHASSQDLGPVSTVHPDTGAAVASSTEVLADLLRVAQGDLPNMSSSSIEDQIGAGWAYALKALALVQRNYDVLGQSATSARTTAEKTGEKLTRAELRIKYLEGARGDLAAEANSLRSTASILEGQVASRDAEIGSLRRQLDSLRASWDVESRQMVADALRDFHAKASERMLAAKERLLGLKQEFIGPCLASAEVVDPEAESALTTELIGVARLLRLPPVPSPPIEDGMKGSSLEFLSAKVGVTAQAGSNLYSSVVDALLAEKRCVETVGVGASTEACQSEEGPSEAVEVPTSQEGAEEVAQGEENLGIPLPGTDDTTVVVIPKELEQVPTEAAPTVVEGQDGEQVADPSIEVKTPPARQTPNGEEDKDGSDPYKHIDFDN